MAERRSLRAVKPDEKPVPPQVLTLDEAIASGDPLEILLAQRRDIAASLPELKGPALPAMHRMLSLVSREIEALKAKASGEAVPGVEVDDEEFDAEAI